jgi:hypothetical protein
MLEWSPDFELGQGDDKVPMQFTVTDQYGAYVDLTGATIQWVWAPKNGGTTATTAAGSVSGTTPNTQAKYLWLAADTATPGNYEGVFEITLASTERITWPAGRKLQISIGAPPA